MLVVETFVHKPGTCWQCGTSTGPALDLERPIDSEGYDGNMYLCVTCAVEIGAAVGCLPAAAAEQVQAAEQALLAQVADLTEQLAEANRAIDAITLVKERRARKNPAKTQVPAA